tara:strand:- start:115 stop:339 length:225 start_codon:yes stop_codon:yes gene_type:complete
MKVGLASLLKTCDSAGCEKTKAQPTRSRFTMLRQLCDLIPAHLVTQSALAGSQVTFTVTATGHPTLRTGGGRMA